MTDPGFRCAAASLLRDEPVAGTASTVRAFLLLEHAGSWGVDALRDARLPDGLGERLRTAAARSGVRILLVRRPGARPSSRSDGDGPWAFAAHADPRRPRLEAGRLADLGEALDLDLTGLRAGRPSGLPAHHGSLLAVCTHGRHDACCAEQGRPVARALARAHPDETWEVSHIGGDRFAGNLLALPHGLYYGRLDPVSALSVAGAHLTGHLDLDRLRGRSGHPMPVQYAEVALRRELAETRLDAVVLTGRSMADHVTEAVFEVAGASYAVRVRTAPGPEPHRLTCRAERDHPIPRHELLGIARRQDRAG